MNKSNSVWLFPGQGSYKPENGNKIFKLIPQAKELFKQAREYTDISFEEIIVTHADDIKKTDIQQPLICIINAAYLYYIKSKGFNSSIFAGHSLGELCACYAAEVVNFKQLVMLAYIRGKLMQKAADLYPGGMLVVIGLNHFQINQILIEKKLTNINIANINSELQIVLSGSHHDLKKLETIISIDTQAISRWLYVSGPWHSKFMESIAGEFKQTLDSYLFRNPKGYLYMAGAQSHINDPSMIKTLLVEQLYSTVNWNGLIKKLYQDFNHVYFVEVGLSTVLRGLNKDILSDVDTYSISQRDDEKKLYRSLEINKDKSHVISV